MQRPLLYSQGMIYRLDALCGGLVWDGGLVLRFLCRGYLVLKVIVVTSDVQH